MPVLQALSPRPPPLALPSSFPKTLEVARLPWHLRKHGDRVSDPRSLHTVVVTPASGPEPTPQSAQQEATPRRPSPFPPRKDGSGRWPCPELTLISCSQEHPAGRVDLCRP